MSQILFYSTLLLLILPVIYKLFFWLYTIQLKEYRWDRYKEYLHTLQGKKAVFNKINYFEFALFLLSILNIYFFYDFLNYFFIFSLFVYNLFVFYKIKNSKILRPKNTSRIYTIYLLFLIGGSIDLYFLVFGGYDKYIFIYSFAVLVFMLFILLFYNFLSLPIVRYKKNKIIKNAINKSKLIDTPIKIAITGSYGKSSVKEFLSSILEQDGSILKTPENINTELGVSSIILNKLKNNFKYFIAEVGAYRIGEINLLGKIVNHKYGFLTAIGNQHIGLFGNQKNIKKGKFEILEKVIENKGFLYVNADNEHIEDYLDKINTTNIIRYGINSNKACAKSKILEIKDLKTKFEFNYNGIQEIFETNLFGEHNILNLTGILAFCYDIGLKTEDLKKYLLNIKLPKNTGEIIKLGNNILIDDTYNLSEAGLVSGIDLLKYFNNKQKILVLDDILELGENSEKIHYNIAEQIATNKYIDKIFFIGVNYKSAFENGLINGGFNKNNLLSIEDFKALKNSLVLLEGKRAKIILDEFNYKNGT